MKYAADFRAIARQALSGKWSVAVLTGFIASLIGAEIASGGGGSNNDSEEKFSFSTRELEAFFGGELWPKIRTLLIIGVVVLVLWLLVTLVIGGAGKLGYAKFNLNLVDGKPAALSDLFSQFDRLGEGFCMNFFMGLYTFLWTLLFVIPGVVKSYSYAMTPYILAEHPEMTANEAITESRRIMDGNKWRLFCLGISFIGWGLLCSLPMLLATFVMARRFYHEPLMLLWLIPLSIPLGVGNLFLRPYEEAAYAAFYRDVSGTQAYTAEFWDDAQI